MKISKRLISLFLVLMLMSSYCSALSSCGDGYEVVCSIEYSVDGEVKTETSTVSVKLSNVGKISQNDYYNSNIEGKRITELPKPQELSKNSRTVTSLEGFDELDIGCRVLYYSNPCPSYLYINEGIDYVFKGFHYEYIRVKVKDKNVIAIKNKDGLSEYNVDYYRITYFYD
ncbi:MAG: hypothetical protein E7634_03275 [Ruminococcaceae bacterium]|nr:hypothetical protein [Oscillospiraceae bacterium]